jgi:hypothetical protein
MTSYTYHDKSKVTPEAKLETYIKVWTFALESARTKKQEINNLIAGEDSVNSFNVDDLIKYGTQVKVYSNILRLADYHGRIQAKSAQEVMNAIRESVTSLVCSDSFINSTSNVSVEIELRERQVWCSIATQLNNF